MARAQTDCPFSGDYLAYSPQNGSRSKSSNQLLFLLVKNGTFIRVEKTGFDRRHVLSELPRYVRNIEGYHKAKGRMYFRGTDGNSTFSTETGERIELSQALTSAEVSSPDWDTMVVQLVEGVGRAGLSSQSKGDFTGKLLQYQIYSSLLSRRTLSLISMPDHIFQLILMESNIQPMGIYV